MLHIIVVAQFNRAKQACRPESKMNETSPQILVNGEEREKRGDLAAKGEECITSVSLEGESPEDDVAAEREAPLKMQAVFQQVRKQLRSQVSAKVPKTSILQLVQKMKDRDVEGVQVSSEPGGDDDSGDDEEQADVLIDECKEKMHPVEKEWCAVFEEKLEVREKALKEEFQAQISQVRKEMQAYTDQALRDLESKKQNRQSHNRQLTHVNEQEGKVHDRKQKNAAAPSLPSKRGRVLTRTMTTIIPKTCPPIILGPRAKSETLSSSKVEVSRFLPRDPMFPVQGNKLHQSHKPLLSAHPPLHQRKKLGQAKTKTGARLGDK